MIDIALVERRVIGVKPERAVLQLYNQLDRAILLARREIHQRVLVTPEFRANFSQRRAVRCLHAPMLA